MRKCSHWKAHLESSVTSSMKPESHLGQIYSWTQAKSQLEYNIGKSHCWHQQCKQTKQKKAVVLWGHPHLHSTTIHTHLNLKTNGAVWGDTPCNVCYYNCWLIQETASLFFSLIRTGQDRSSCGSPTNVGQWLLILTCSTTRDTILPYSHYIH